MAASEDATPAEVEEAGGTGDEDTESGDEGPPRLVSRRRLVSFAVGAVLYVGTLVAVAVRGGDASATYTVHTVRYLTVVAVVYTAASAANVSVGYLRDGRRHDDTFDLVGGVGVVAGFGVFYSRVISVETVEPRVGALTLSAVAISLGMLSILKIDL